MTMTRLLLGTLLVAFANLASAQTVGGTCSPTNVAQVENRVHIQCEQPVYDGATAIYWFALPTLGSGDESKSASRLMAVGLTAISIGKQVSFSFTAGDTNGTAYGCAADNCRRPIAFSLQR